MRLNHWDDVHAIVEALDFSSTSTVVDVGGGNGSLLRAILSRYAELRGVLFERDQVVERAGGPAVGGAHVALLLRSRRLF